MKYRSKNKIKWIKHDVYYERWTFEREKGARTYTLPYQMNWLTDKLGDLLVGNGECLVWYAGGKIDCVEYTNIG